MAPSARNIGFMVPSFDRGGLEGVVVDLHHAFKKLGVKSTIFVENGEPGYLASTVDRRDVVFFRRHPSDFFSELVSRRINVLHYNYSTFELEAAVRLGIKTIYVLHNAYTWLGNAAFMDRARMIAAADARIAVANFCRDYFLDRARISNLTVEVVNNGIGQELFPAGTERATDGGYVFAMIGRFDRVKHHMALVGATEKLFARGLRPRVLFIGGGGDSKYEKEITGRVAKSPANELFEFVGPLSRQQVLAKMSTDIDCVVVPSLQEGFGLVAFEAAMSGCRVVATDTGAARELQLVAPEHTQLVPAAANPLELSQAKIYELSSSTDSLPNVAALAASMQEAMQQPGRLPALELAGTEFTLEKMVRGHLEIISRLAESPS